MARKIVLLIFILNSLLLTSCSFGIDESEEKMADTRMKQLLSSINDHDEEAMKALFSNKVLDESENIDSEIDYLFDFFKGDVKSWENDRWSSGESIEHGKKTVMLRTWYSVITDKDEYMFFIIDFTEDTINPDNEGLYTLRVIKAKDEETQFGFWQDMNIAGIYKPKE